MIMSEISPDRSVIRFCRRGRADGDSRHGLANSTGLPGIPQQQGISATGRRDPAHANRRFRREAIREQNRAAD